MTEARLKPGSLSLITPQARSARSLDRAELNSFVDVGLGSSIIDEAALVAEDQGQCEDLGVAIPDSIKFLHEGDVQVKEGLDVAPPHDNGIDC